MSVHTVNENEGGVRFARVRRSEARRFATKRFAVSGAAALALAATMLLSGCAPTDPSDAATASLDASVVQTADRAASGDYAGAAANLDVLQARLAEYVEAGDVTADRSAEIQAAIDAVRADLTALIAAQATPTPEPTETGTGVTDQTETQAPAPAPVETVRGTVETPPDDGTDDQGPDTSPGNGDQGKGNPGNGNPGKGNRQAGKGGKD